MKYILKLTYNYWNICLYIYDRQFECEIHWMIFFAFYMYTYKPFYLSLKHLPLNQIWSLESEIITLALDIF